MKNLRMVVPTILVSLAFGVVSVAAQIPGNLPCRNTDRTHACYVSGPGMGETCPNELMSCPHHIITSELIEVCVGATVGKSGCDFADAYGLCYLLLAHCIPDGFGGYWCQQTEEIHHVYYATTRAVGASCE